METPKEWFRANPTATMNDYYSYQRKNGKVYSAPVSVPTYNNVQIHHTQTITFPQSTIVGIIFSIIGIIGYFTPWFSVPILNISVSGNELSQIFKFFSEQNVEGGSSVLLNYAIAVPITFTAILFGALMKSYFISILSGILNLVIIGFILGDIFLRFNEFLNMLSIGIYLILFSFLGILYFLLSLKFKK